jgi:D-3-phosphoglycerate dehydrogenase
MRIVIPDDYQDAVRHLTCFETLASHQVTVYHDHTEDIETLATRFQEADALVLIRERTPITEPLLARLPALKLIVQTGRQAPPLDLDACTRHGIVVAFSEGGSNPYATAELTWGLILAARRHIPQEVAQMKTGHWQTTLGLGLYGQTLGIFGYGRIGRVTANYGCAFGMKVLVWGRERSLEQARSDGFELAASQDALFQQADVLSLHLKLVEETRSIVTPAHLAQMKPSALLVNTSRAALIEPGALEAAVGAGRPG